MINGPGKYNAEAGAVRQSVGGEVLLIVIGGSKGTGFEVAASVETLAKLPEILRRVAADIESLAMEGAES